MMYMLETDAVNVYCDILKKYCAYFQREVCHIVYYENHIIKYLKSI